jgi:hypothetical protein
MGWVKDVPSWLLALCLTVVAILLVYLAVTNRPVTIAGYLFHFHPDPKIELGVWYDISGRADEFDLNCEYRLDVPSSRVAGEAGSIAVTFVAPHHLFAYFKVVGGLRWLQVDYFRKNLAADGHANGYDIPVRTLIRCAGPPRT